MKSVKIFLSYSSENQSTSRKIKHCMESCLGFDVFLSGEKIRTSEDWFKKIWTNLHSCNIFMPILSRQYESSFFGNQELGFAVGKGKRIFPVSIDGKKSFGLIEHMQVFPLGVLDDNSFIDESQISLLVEIFYVIFNNEKFKDLENPSMDCLVKALENSSHYKITSIIFNLMKQFSSELKFTDEQLKIIKNSVENNPEIYEAGLIFPSFKEFLQKRYKIVIDR